MTGLDKLIDDFFKRLGFNELEPDEDGIFTLLVEDQLPVMLQFLENGSVSLAAGIGSLEGKDVGLACRRLLEGNHPASPTAHFTVCLLPGTLNVMLTGQVVTPINDAEGLVTIFDAFVTAAEAWRDALPDLDQTTETPDESERTPSQPRPSDFV